MKYLLKIVFFLSVLVFISGCISADFYKTGKEFSPLNENADITIFSGSKAGLKFEKIGLLRIRGGSKDRRIEEARLYARKKGGNGIIIREVGIITDPDTDNVVENIGSSTYDTQEFVIIKFDSGKFDTTGDNKNLPIESNANSLSIDFNLIPRATYNQLIGDYQSLKGRLFRGTLYPKKIYKIPSDLKPYTEESDRLVLLTTKSGKNKLYLLIKQNNITDLMNKIKAGSVMDFIYSPDNILKSKEGTHPVIKFVEEVTEVKK